MPRNNTDPRIDTYIEPLPVWQQAICREVRDLAHAADETARTVALRQGEKIPARA
jgi:hypothetical protein